MSLAFIPLYIQLMGVESYGLVGFYVSLATVLSFMELGMGTTLNRELARLNGRDGSASLEARNLLRSFECLIWPGSLALALVVAGLSPEIARYWLNGDELNHTELALAVALMGAAIAMRLPFAVYSGGLCGLQRQGIYNLVLIVGATLRSGGVVLALLWWQPTITVFFLWHIGIECLQSLLAAICLWRVMPGKGSGRVVFQWSAVQRVWRFSGSMMLISLLATAVSQLDKLMVGRWLSLEMLGYYAVAVAVASGLFYVAYPVNTAMFPRFSELLARGDKPRLIAVYRRASRLMAVIVWPVATLLMFFSAQILGLWTGDAHVVEASSAVLSVLSLSVAINAVSLLPASLILAEGRSAPLLWVNGLVLLALLIVLPDALAKWGLLAAAGAFLVLNICYVVVYVGALYPLFRFSETGRWLIADIFPPALISLLVMWAAKKIYPGWQGEFAMLAYMIFSLLVVAFFATWAVRRELFIVQKPDAGQG